MGDQSDGDHVSDREQKFKASRDDLELSSDNLSDDTTKTKTKSDPKPSGIRYFTNFISEGHGKKKKVNQPGKPVVKHVTWDSVDIEWDAVAGFRNGDTYQVRLKNTKEGSWEAKYFITNSGKIMGLQPGNSYIFNVRLVKADGKESEFGENSKEVTTKEEPIPGKPLVTQVFADCITIIWTRVDTFCKGDVYEVHVENIDTKKNICHKFDVNGATIGDLQSDTTYVFKVRLVNQNGQESPYSDNSDRVKTFSTFASQLISKHCLVPASCNGPALYELPLDEVQDARNEDAMSIKYKIGPQGRNQTFEKTIMLVGASGTGKSTFVDSLANYVLGVRLEDPYRFTVTREEDREKQKNKAKSQTDWITTYTFNPQKGTRLTYRLNVIDTPGVGDTRGEERDKNITDQIHKLIKAPGEKGVQTIDAVCFFVKASDCRLTDAQSYIFNAIQSFFGKDIIGNICLLITFADGSDPAVMDAVKESGLPYGEKFYFNNLPCSSDPSESSSFFWKLNSENFKALFDHLERLETKSLQLTKEVLIERQCLKITYQNLESHINDRISLLNAFKEEMKLFHEHMDEIKANTNFTYTGKEVKVISVELPEKERATNCLICKTTCHKNCWPFLEGMTYMCWVFSWRTGNCSQCPKHCNWKSHKTTRYKFITYVEDVQKTYADMQKSFQDATKKLMNAHDVLKNMRDQKDAQILEIKFMLKTMLKSRNRLNEIALRPEKCTVKEQIEQLIKAERTEGQPGFEDRIIQLNRLFEEASLFEDSPMSSESRSSN